jgi:hypothetical protein
VTVQAVRVVTVLVRMNKIGFADRMKALVILSAAGGSCPS